MNSARGQTKRRDAHDAGNEKAGRNVGGNDQCSIKTGRNQWVRMTYNN